MTLLSHLYSLLYVGNHPLQFMITTIAGMGSFGGGGDGGAATNAQFMSPYGVATDALGNIFIADTDNNKIRVVNSTGSIETFAGTGTPGHRGDGGAATNAQLANPFGVATDAFGNIFIADTNNNKIRVVNSTGIITTIAGTGLLGSSGDGGAAINASLSQPKAVAIDSYGNVFIADTNNCKIRVVKSTTGNITTFAGTGANGNGGDGGLATNSQLSYPRGVATDAFGNVFISDTNNNNIRVVNSAGIITTIAGTGTPGYSGDGGMATNAQLSYPQSVVVDMSGNVYIPDQGNNIVRLVTNGTRIITTFAGGYSNYGSLGDGGAATDAHLSYPGGLAIDVIGGNIIIADTYDYRIRKVTYFNNYPTSQPSSSSVPTRKISVLPSSFPTHQPSSQPSRQPISEPSVEPSSQPSMQPSSQPSRQPSTQPSVEPSNEPSEQPSIRPSAQPSEQPNACPSVQPTCRPSMQPSILPTIQPTAQPSESPTNRTQPTTQPSGQPSYAPSGQPSFQPTMRPSSQPSVHPSHQPSRQPTVRPSNATRPSSQPTVQPSRQPTRCPSRVRDDGYAHVL